MLAVAVRVVIAWLMLSLEGIANREKERSDMMKIGNGILIQIIYFTIHKNVEGTVQLLQLHMKKKNELNQLTSLYSYLT